MTEKKSIKAELKIVLQANDTIVAESTDPVLWQKVLAAINMPKDETKENIALSSETEIHEDALQRKGPIENFAKELGVSVELIKGACGPSESSPFIHLDKHHWEAMKKGTPARGPKSISAIVLASTLLILWKEKNKLAGVTLKEAQKVLGTLGLRDNHPQRALQSCEWLQMRGSNIIINPAQTSKAIALARAYCTKEHK